MKSKVLITSIFLLMFSVVLKAQTPAFTEAKLNEVKVYFNGAELSQSANLKLPKGTSEVVITNVANNIDENSIRVKSVPNITVMSVQYSNKYLESYDNPQVSPILKSTQGELDNLKKQLSELKNLRKSYAKSIELLDANRDISKNGSFTVEELKKMTTYYQNKRYELANKIDALDIQKEKLAKQVEGLEFEMGLSSSNSQKRNFNKIILQVMNEKEGAIPFEISYLTRNASWQPFYDMRVERLNAPIELTYKASVQQNTGIDWKQVTLGLSSGYMNRYSRMPKLYPWFINYYSRQLNSIYKKNTSKELITAEKTEASELTQIEEKQLGITFDISVPYTILSNGKGHSVSLKETELPAAYQYYTAPKLDPTAYLITSVEDYGKYNLLPGKANVIFEGLYVGNTMINPNSETDNAMQLSMGRDEKISVMRQKISEKSGTRFFSSKKTQIFTYEITIRNNKKDAIEIEVEDQFPISQDESIEVELKDTDRAKVDREKGFLKWNLKIKPNETKKIRFTYEVKSNKDEKIGNL